MVPDGVDENTVLERNSSPEYADACASHDFCDANMAMNEVFENLGQETPENEKVNPEPFKLWGRVWDLAKARKFYPPPSPVGDSLYE